MRTSNAMSKRGDHYVQSFARGLAVIRCFGPDARAMTISEIARRTELTRAATRRILLTLEQLRYVRADNRQFSLTPQILALGYSYLATLPFWDFAQPIMEELVARTHETCSIAVLDLPDIVYVMRVPTRRILRNNLSIGSRLPAYAQSMGRVLLGSLRDDELDHYLATVPRKAFTKRTVVDASRLRAIIDTGRRKGAVWVDGELEEGICGIAVPVLDRDGRILAAMNIALNTGRSSEAKAMRTLLPLLRRAAARISAGLNVRPTLSPR